VHSLSEQFAVFIGLEIRVPTKLMTERQAKILGIAIAYRGESPRCELIEETERGLEWALAYETDCPREQGDTLEAKLAESARDEVWQITSSLLYGLGHLEPNTIYTSSEGTKFNCVSTGDFHSFLNTAKDAMARLETVTEEIARIRSG
jgi:hypothetical protein